MATKNVFTSGSLTVGTASYAITDMNFNESVSSVDVTDTATAADSRELIYGRATRKFSVDMWQDISGSDIPLKTKYPITLDYGGKKYVGSGSLESRDVKGKIDDVSKVTLAGQFSGPVTVTP